MQTFVCNLRYDFLSLLTANQNWIFVQDCQRSCQQINADSKKLKFQMQEEKNNYLANFEKQKEKLLLEQKRLVSSNTALVNQNDILKTTLESREVAWRRQVQLLEEKGNVTNFPTRYSRFFWKKVDLYGKSWQPLSDIEIAKLKKQNLEISEEMNKMKLKFETESRVLSDRFQFASNQVTFRSFIRVPFWSRRFIWRRTFLEKKLIPYLGPVQSK